MEGNKVHPWGMSWDSGASQRADLEQFQLAQDLSVPENMQVNRG